MTAAVVPSRSQPGFTLLELVVTLAIVAVLLALALPSYRHYAQRAERAEAVRQLLAAAACQESVRAGAGFYDTSRCLPADAGGDYRFRFEPVGEARARSFVLHAEPGASQPGDRCGGLSLDQAGSRRITGDSQYLADCWGGR